MAGSFVPGVVRGSLSLLIYVVNTVFWCIFLYTIALVKLIVPIPWFRRVCNRVLIAVSFSWIFCNNMNQNLFSRTPIIASGLEGLDKDGWYLVVSNHQTWVDILVLQRVFYHKIPFLKFFLKKELIWVPVLGFAWWALDFPFMKRYSKHKLLQKPHLKGKDLESTKKACEKFKHTPVSIMNFVEGTRFTPTQKKKQNNSFNHLLSPKASGISFVLGAMGEYLHTIIDVTIVYPEKIPTFWEFISGRVKKIIIDFEVIPLPGFLKGDYLNDADYKKRIFFWLNELWLKKDQKIDALKTGRI